MLPSVHWRKTNRRRRVTSHENYLQRIQKSKLPKPATTASPQGKLTQQGNVKQKAAILQVVNLTKNMDMKIKEAKHELKMGDADNALHAFSCILYWILNTE